jgi:hypothetical protein
MNNEKETMRKEVVVAYFQTASPYPGAGTEKDHGNHVIIFGLRNRSEPITPRYETDVLPIGPRGYYRRVLTHAQCDQISKTTARF